MNRKLDLDTNEIFPTCKTLNQKLRAAPVGVTLTLEGIG